MVPPSKKAADVNLWIKASKEDHTVGDDTQARTCKSRYVLPLGHLFWSPPVFSCQDWFHTVTVGQGLGDHLGPATFWYVPSPKKSLGISENSLAVAFHSAHEGKISTPLSSASPRRFHSEHPLLPKASLGPISKCASLSLGSYRNSSSSVKGKAPWATGSLLLSNSTNVFHLSSFSPSWWSVSLPYGTLLHGSAMKQKWKVSTSPENWRCCRSATSPKRCTSGFKPVFCVWGGGSLAGNRTPTTVLRVPKPSHKPS